MLTGWDDIGELLLVVYGAVILLIVLAVRAERSLSTDPSERRSPWLRRS